MPTRGFGAKKVNIDSYIRKKSDADSDIASAAETTDRQGDDVKDFGDNSASGSGIAEDQDVADDRERYDEDTDEEMAYGQHAFNEKEDDDDEEEEEWGSS